MLLETTFAKLGGSFEYVGIISTDSIQLDNLPNGHTRFRNVTGHIDNDLADESLGSLWTVTTPTTYRISDVQPQRFELPSIIQVSPPQLAEGNEAVHRPFDSLSPDYLHKFHPCAPSASPTDHNPNRSFLCANEQVDPWGLPVFEDNERVCYHHQTPELNNISLCVLSE